MISHAKLNIPFDVQAVQDEVNSLSQPWSLHFNTKHYEGEWTVLSLRIPGGDSDRIIPEISQDEECRDTPLMARCPAVKALLNSMHCEILTVRFLNLKTGANIKPHRDHELAFENGEARLHFPVLTNEHVEFFIEEELVRMNEGECWYINANLTHHVANKGTTDRIHLVVDCKVNDWLKQVFEQGEQKLAKVNREEILQVIAELRSQQTEVASRLAMELERTHFL
jgi:hypothetical protein